MSVWRTSLIVVLVSVFWIYIPQLLSPKLQPVWGGFTHKDFKHVEKIFRQAVEDGRLRGGSVAAYYKGEVIVDLWGGYADVEAHRPWGQDTVTLFYSTTKFMGPLVLATMAEKGLLDYKKPVSHYWPEFGQNGKDKITVEMLLSHQCLVHDNCKEKGALEAAPTLLEILRLVLVNRDTKCLTGTWDPFDDVVSDFLKQAGIAILDTPISVFDIRDKPEEIEKLLARQVPEYEPGSQFGYHSVTFGLYVDTLVRKIDPRHRNISQIFQEDIAQPFGIDFYIGLPLHLYFRSTKIYTMTLVQIIWDIVTSGSTSGLKFLYLALPLSGSSWSKSLGAVKELDREHVSPELASIGFTTFNGHGTARSLAKLFSIMATGGVYKGRKLMSPKIIDYLGTPVVNGTDQTIFEHLTLGPGTFLKKNPKGQIIFGQPGFGAQIAFADPHTELGFSFCTNFHRGHHMWNDPLLLELQNAIYAAIDLKDV